MNDTPRELVFTERRVPVTGKLQIIFMRGARPTIVGSDILIDPKQTSVVSIFDDKNLVVDSGRLVLREVMSGDLTEVDPIHFFCTGTGGYIGENDCQHPPNDPLGTDLDLRIQLFSKAISSTEHPNSLATTFITTVEESESNGNLTEFGLKTASGKLFARRTTRPMYKDTNVFFVCRWTIQF